MKICRRCGQPVRVYETEYDIFEGMHWICFHFEFEHGEFDPDEPCNDPSCPWNRINNKQEFILENEKSYTVHKEQQFLGLYVKEHQKEFYPSAKLLIVVESFNNYVANKSVWLEKTELNEFILKTKELHLKNEKGLVKLESMTPNEFEIEVEKSRLGQYQLKYKLQSRYLNDYKSEIIGSQEIEYLEIERLCKYFKDVVSFI
ncbi:hypothetical protein [Gorillibacterium sp. sgz5001074]|uniref:hypothetical protein n=1 Tax=Gorillibacterium sp. sgz5001074 TaxID=3446695 RepID=UPI003F660FC9